MTYSIVHDAEIPQMDHKQQEEEEEPIQQQEDDITTRCKSNNGFWVFSTIMSYFIIIFIFLRFAAPPNQITTINQYNNNDKNFLLPPHKNESLVLARVVHLVLVENMEEVQEFIHLFPGFSSDVIFNCWNDHCFDPRQDKTNREVYVGSWTSQKNYPYRTNRLGEIELFDRFEDTLMTYEADEKYWKIRPTVYFINELDDSSIKKPTTLTESRNLLAKFVLEQELKQGWKWAYINIMDGDAHLTCDFLESISDQESDMIKKNQQHRWMSQYYKWIQEGGNQLQSVEFKCFLAFNSFVLTVSPGIGLPGFFEYNTQYLTGDGLITFHWDGILSSFHHSLFPIFHLLCEKFDSWTIWTSQSYLILQSVCIMGHALTNTYFRVLNQDHRNYQHNPPFDPWTKEIIKELNIIPERLLYYLDYLLVDNYFKYKPILLPLTSFNFYQGFDISMIEPDCRTKIMDPKTCIRVQQDP